MNFRSKWMDWSVPTRTYLQKTGAISANALGRETNSGTYGTPHVGCRWRILAYASVNPEHEPAPTDNNTPLPIAEITQAIHQGAVALTWSRPCESWTYWVYDNAAAKRIREKFPNAVVYTVLELNRLAKAGIRPEFAKTIHLSKEVLGGFIESVSSATPQKADSRAEQS